MSLHERMMQSHDSGDKGAPKDIVSANITLKDKQQIAEGTFEFTFAKPADFFPYKAGQHGRITLIEPPETDAEGNARFLSFASTPDEPDLRFAMRMRNTAFKRILGSMKPGEQVLFQMRQESMHGSFALQDATDTARPAVFLIGGIGIVPVFSMIKDALAHDAQHKITLFYSNRRPEDAPYLMDLQKLAKANPSIFELVATMTEPEKSTQQWNGETGFITKEMVQKYVPDITAPIYYTAGLTEMVSAMKKLLADAGIKKDSIRAEEFGAFTAAHADKQKKKPWKHYLSIIAIGLLIVAIIAVHVIGIAVPNWLLNILALLVVVKIGMFVMFKMKGRHGQQKGH